MNFSLVDSKMWQVAVLVLSLSSLVYGAPLVPCYFSFGDGFFDNGNNNALRTTIKANYLPYGIDFPQGPVGRFSNGRVIPDILAQRLGFTNSTPSFVNEFGRSILNGVNYASGAAGILDYTGIFQGDRVSFNRQLLNHQVTIARIAVITARNRSAAVDLRQCLYTVGIGSSDYIYNYYSGLYPTSRIYTPERYATLLTNLLSVQLRILYNLRARKVAVFGISPLGCTPAAIRMFGTNGSTCVESINNAVQSFNDKLKPLMDNLNSNLPGAMFTYVNTYQIVNTTASNTTSGITVTNRSCCVTNTTTFLCNPFSTPCGNRNEYKFFDEVHLTEVEYERTTNRSYTAAQPGDTYPSDIQTLVARPISS